MDDDEFKQSYLALVRHDDEARKELINDYLQANKLAQRAMTENIRLYNHLNYYIILTTCLSLSILFLGGWVVCLLMS